MLPSCHNNQQRFFRAYRRIIGLILLVLLSLTTTLSIPALSAREVAQTSETMTQTSNARALLQQGIELYEVERFSEAAELWQQANAAFSQLGDTLGQALVLSNLSSAYQQLGQWKEAQGYIEQSLNLLQALEKTTNSQDYREIFAKALNARGNLYWEKGLLREALSNWKQATRNYAVAGQVEGIVRSAINQSKALQALGLSREAQEMLEQVYYNLQQQPDSNLKATGLRHLGNALRRVGKLDRSRRVLDESLALAKLPKAKSLTLLELGNTERALGERTQAIGKEGEYQKHIQAAIAFYQQAASNPDGQLQAQLNLLSLLVETGEKSQARELSPKIQEAVASLPPSRTAIYARLNLAQSLTKLGSGEWGQGDAEKKDKGDKGDKGDSQIHPLISSFPHPLISSSPQPLTSPSSIAQIVATAVQHAQSLQDQRAESYALGQLGGLYELTNQELEAQKLTERALLLVEMLQAPDIRYRWEWQLGRILKKQRKIQQATAAYTRAVEALESIRSDLLTISSDVQFSFRDNVQPLYRELVDLLLRTGGNTPPSPQNLKEAVRQIDALQLGELENFLGCNLSEVTQIEQVKDPKAAIIYPIILKDRIAIIFELPGQNQQLVFQETQVPRSEVEQTLRELRKDLTIPDNTPEVLASAQKVYEWIIKPIEPLLEQSTQIETLVFVPDGLLRNVPMAVLYDGKQYLLEKDYAIAVAPRVKLFSPQPAKEKLSLFAGGVGIPQVINNTQFPEIELLREELARVAEETQTSKPLLNEDFTKLNIEQWLQARNFNGIHWKTHGEFSSDPEETYIVAYKERLVAQDLSNLIETGSQMGAKPLELLVLSACKTAQGDDRAVLGLAGIAVRTGTRSVLSTLWVAQDAPNTEFMARFYEELSKPGMTKAKAVRQAQLALFREKGYTTPHIWATYILVGNWL